MQILFRLQPVMFVVWSCQLMMMMMMMMMYMTEHNVLLLSVM